jgi:hypothetical protein
MGEKARRGANSKDHPRGHGNRDPETADALGKITSCIEEEWSVFEGLIGRLEEGLRIEVVTMWEAFSSFSREELGAEPKTLIKAWFEPMLEEIEEVEDALDTTETNPQRLQEYASDLRQLWRKLVA